MIPRKLRFITEQTLRAPTCIKQWKLNEQEILGICEGAISIAEVRFVEETGEIALAALTLPKSENNANLALPSAKSDGKKKDFNSRLRV